MYSAKSWAWLAASLLLTSSLPAGHILVSTNAGWRFFPGHTEASSPDTAAWRYLEFNDAAWQSKAATFYYGESGFAGTLLSDMQNSYPSFFLRKTFTLTNAAAHWENLTIGVACDDGYIAWINGVPVAWQAPPAETNANALASAVATEPVTFVPQLVTDPATCLRDGTNLLAVQVFNVSLGSSDIVFDLELSGELKPDLTLRVDDVQPPPGLLPGLTNVRVAFSEPVTNVQLSDLLINGLPASGFSGSGAVYNYNFTQPPYGPVWISWDPRQQITTVALPKRTLLPSTPGTSWGYELIDPAAPRIAQVQPATNATVRLLRQLEVYFDKPVTGIEAADLLINGTPATNLVIGGAAGPYTFSFPAAPAGPTHFAWTANHGITSDVVDPIPFSAGSWSCTVDPHHTWGDVILNEFLALSESLTNLKDEEGDVEPWIELFNRGSSPVNLGGWSLTDDPDSPGRWVFPSTTIPPQTYLVVFASAKDRRPATPGARLHANFKLSPNGEYLGLYTPDAPRQLVDELAPRYPDQGPDHSYGRAGGGWRYFASRTPGAFNGSSSITSRVGDIHFSVARGFLTSPVHLSLSTPTVGALIRYTLDGSVPTLNNGTNYTAPLLIDRTRIVRAAAFKNQYLPSRVATHTYLYNLPVNRRYLPTLSIVTATNHLYGASGIMEYNPRNTTKHGIAWERPASVEWLRPEDNGGFHVDCGLRVAGGDYIRERYNYRSNITTPEGKYSFRLYFRGDYGTGRLRYPLFPTTTLDSFDVVTLRAGMNDVTNPFLRDELARQLASDTGQVASHGTFVNLFLNGVSKGYYNPTERIDESFLADYHGGGELWDVIAQSSEVNQGDLREWTSLRSFIRLNPLTNATSYAELGRRLDLTNFVDYLLPLTYADTDDWPHNNWRVARERVPGAPFRFYVWDAEWSFGYNNSYTHNTIAGQLSSTSPPWGSTEIQEIFNKLKRLTEFKLLFADRVHKHLFNGGALTDESIRSRYDQLKSALAGTISGFNDTIGTSWIPNRRRYFTNHLYQAGFLASSNAPAFSQFGGPIPQGYHLTMTALAGTIYFTTNLSDPRVPFTAGVHSNAFPYANPVTLHHSAWVKARTLHGTNWSALTEASFLVEQRTPLLRITELMYHPVGGDTLEFLEIQNVGSVPIDLQGYSLEGVEFRFPVGFPLLPPGERIVLAADRPENPAAFALAYPGVPVAGFFGGSLANEGERVALLDPTGRTVSAVTYADSYPWPTTADGLGPSLELIDPFADPNDPANWQPSTQPNGSPGAANGTPLAPTVRLNELYAANNTTTSGSDWLELHNPGATPLSLAGWSVSDNTDPRRFVFPAETTIPAAGYLVLWCDTVTSQPGLHAGFGLGDQSETVTLYNASTTRVDAVTYGPQIPGFTLGRVDATAPAWTLTEPTPGAPNEPATLGSPIGLWINEFLANPPAGADDWIELHNRNPVFPVSLRGLWLGTSNALFQINAPGFIPPGGFVVLYADENPQPNHLDFRLPATGGAIALFNNAGTQVHRLTYLAQSEGVATGCLPDGSATFLPLPGSATPGFPNRLARWTGPILSEFMARNEDRLTNSAGRFADWIELYNPQTTPFDLAGFGLQFPDSDPWPFPNGFVIPAQSYSVVWCDGSRPASVTLTAPINSGQSLDANSGTIALLEPTGQPVDTVDYGFQLRNQSVGRVGTNWRLLNSPTPGAANSLPAFLENPEALRLNEWMANSSQEEDWFELFNPQPAPVSLTGLFLTDDPTLSGQTNFTVGPLSFIAPQGFVLWRADGRPENGRNHVNFSLDAAGETLRLYHTNRILIDAVDYVVQQNGASEGRWPDGASNILRFVITSSPAASNYLPLPGIVISELLTHADPPYEDAIELHNPAPAPADVGGWYLSDNPAAPKKFRIPDGTTLPTGGYQAFYQVQFGAPTAGTNAFTLDSAHGGTVVLSKADSQDQLTGHRQLLPFGAAANAVPFGRIETSLGPQLSPLIRPTFGINAPDSLTAFRSGKGAPNAQPLVGPVVLSEIHYHPAPSPLDESILEFVEVYNATATAQPLFDPLHPTNGWQIAGGIDYSFPTNLTLAPRSTLLVVGFDPANRPDLLAEFRATYDLATATPIVGPFQGRLSNSGERIDLQRPDNPQGPDRPDAGFVPYLLVDGADYRPAGAWPSAADGTGPSLQRIDPLRFGNEPLNWQAATPNPGTVSLPTHPGDSDGDGLPDSWELTHGFNPLDAADASADADNDGLTNLDEFLGGTDPHLATSVLALDCEVLNEEYRLHFLARSDRSYSVEYATDPAVGQWVLLETVPAATGDRLIELYLTRASFPAPRYFRLITPSR